MADAGRSKYYGFDPSGTLVFGDGAGRLMNTKPQQVIEALSHETVGARIQKAVGWVFFCLTLKHQREWRMSQSQNMAKP